MLVAAALRLLSLLCVYSIPATELSLEDENAPKL